MIKLIKETAKVGGFLGAGSLLMIVMGFVLITEVNLSQVLDLSVLSSTGATRDLFGFVLAILGCVGVAARFGKIAFDLEKRIVSNQKWWTLYRIINNHRAVGSDHQFTGSDAPFAIIKSFQKLREELSDFLGDEVEEEGVQLLAWKLHVIVLDFLTECERLSGRSDIGAMNFDQNELDKETLTRFLSDFTSRYRSTIRGISEVVELMGAGSTAPNRVLRDLLVRFEGRNAPLIR